MSENYFQKWSAEVQNVALSLPIPRGFLATCKWCNFCRGLHRSRKLCVFRRFDVRFSWNVSQTKTSVLKTHRKINGLPYKSNHAIDIKPDPHAYIGHVRGCHNLWHNKNAVGVKHIVSRLVSFTSYLRRIVRTIFHFFACRNHKYSHNNKHIF